jgi:hypothetical protein
MKLLSACQYSSLCRLCQAFLGNLQGLEVRF